MKIWQRYDLEQLKEIRKTSKSGEDFLRKLGYKKCYGRTLYEISQKYPELQLDFFIQLENKVIKKSSNPNFEDLTGQKFNHLTVLQQGPYTKGKLVRWICRCDCGNITRPIRAAHLKDGHTKSCGCLQAQKTRQRSIDITGECFGKLVVLEKVENMQKGAYWICQCDCGNITKPISGSSLRSGNTRSCGCLKSSGEEKISQILLDNNISFIKEYNFPDLVSPLGRRLRFDFAIFENYELKALIEYQGQQHYKSVDYYGGEEKLKQRMEYDKLKREYCNKKNIKLIEISYKELSLIDFNWLKDKIDN